MTLVLSAFTNQSLEMALDSATSKEIKALVEVAENSSQLYKCISRGGSVRTDL
jgi:hypothetical protein